MPTSDNELTPDFLAIRALIDLGSDGIAALADAIGRISLDLVPLSEHSRELCEELTELGVDKDKLVAILEHAVEDGVDARLSSGSTPEEFVDSMKQAVEELDFFPPEYSDHIDQCRESLARLFGLEVLSLRSKAASLSGARPNWVHNLRIVTELRPVFDESRESVKANLIANTLELTYRADDGIRTMYFAIDPIDLDKLDREIQQARTKNNSVVALCNKDSLPSLGLGLRPIEREQ